jgi:hypothetical protein
VNINALERVVIVDDNERSRNAYALAVEDADLEPVKVDGHLGELETFVGKTPEHAGVLSDFELSVANFADFSGAQLVSRLYRSRVPGVLCTKYEKSQIDRIRPFRRWIPRLITPGELDPDSLMRGFEVAFGEFDGKFLQSRSPHRTLIRIVESDAEDTKSFFLQVPAWSSEVIRYRYADVPAGLVEEIRPGFRTHVVANIGAEAFEDVYLTDWGVV